VKRLLLSVLLVLFAAPALAATNMLTADGITSPGTSTCPATGGGNCSSGWFSIRGAGTAVVHLWQTAGTSTITLEQRLDTTDATSVIKTWTNATATEVPIVITAPAGDIRINATAVSGGTVKAKLEVTSRSGARVW
jgi:hypothetical protein